MIHLHGAYATHEPIAYKPTKLLSQLSERVGCVMSNK